MIVREGKLVISAVGFLTRIPVGRWAARSDEQINHSSRYFPLVGAAIGVLGAAVLSAAAALLPIVVAAVLSIVATVLITGAIHEDGLADTCDAFGGGITPEDVCRILADSRIGAFGAVGLILALALKTASLALLPLAAATVALVCAHAFSRSMCVAIMACGRYARREGGKTRAVASGVRKRDAAIAVGIGLTSFALAPLTFLLAVPAAFAVCMVMYAYFRARIGGYTGDCMGAIQQVSEITCYLTFLALEA